MSDESKPKSKMAQRLMKLAEKMAKKAAAFPAAAEWQVDEPDAALKIASAATEISRLARTAQELDCD